MCDCRYLSDEDLRLGQVIHFSRKNAAEHHDSNRWLVVAYDDVKQEWMMLDILSALKYGEPVDGDVNWWILPVRTGEDTDLKIRKWKRDEPRGEYA